jgi:hypothetical protein
MGDLERFTSDSSDFAGDFILLQPTVPHAARILEQISIYRTPSGKTEWHWAASLGTITDAFSVHLSSRAFPTGPRTTRRLSASRATRIRLYRAGA